MTGDVGFFKELILDRLQGETGPAIDVRRDERYPDWLVEIYPHDVEVRKNFNQATIELLRENNIPEDVNRNSDIRLDLVALCRRLNIREAEDELLSLAESLNREELIPSDDWDLMSEILSALSVIGARKSKDFLLQQLTYSPSKQYQKGAFTALQRIDLAEALKYLPKFAEVNNENDDEDFLAILYGLLYAVDEEHLPGIVDLIVKQFTGSSEGQGEYLEKKLLSTRKAKAYLDKIKYVLIFKYRCWYDLKPREIAELLHTKPNEVYKKWHVLKHEFLIPILIEKGVLAPDGGLLEEDEEGQKNH